MISVEFWESIRHIGAERTVLLVAIDMPVVPSNGEEVEIGIGVYLVERRSWRIDKGYYDESGNGGRDPSVMATVMVRNKFTKWKHRKTGEVVEIYRANDPAGTVTTRDGTKLSSRVDRFIEEYEAVL